MRRLTNEGRQRRRKRRRRRKSDAIRGWSIVAVPGRPALRLLNFLLRSSQAQDPETSPDPLHRRPHQGGRSLCGILHVRGRDVQTFPCRAASGCLSPVKPLPVAVEKTPEKQPSTSSPVKPAWLTPPPSARPWKEMCRRLQCTPGLWRMRRHVWKRRAPEAAAG